MKFCCTRKVIDQLKTDWPIELKKIDRDSNTWYVDRFVIKSKRHFMITNSISLYTIFIPSGTRRQRQSFPTLFYHALKTNLSGKFGVTDSLVIDKFIFNSVSVAKTNSRSILGSMTDFKNMSQAILEDIHYTDDIYAALDFVNKSPMNMINMNNANELMSQYLNE